MASTFTRKLENDIGITSVIIDNYAVPANTTVTVIGLSIANIVANTINVDVLLDSGSSNTHLIKNAPIPSGGSLIVIGGDQKVVLSTGDSIRVKSSEASSADSILSLLELT